MPHSVQEHPVTVGFDIGGTNLRAAVVRDGAIIDRRSVDTPKDPNTLQQSIVELVDELRESYQVNGVGLAIAGFLDPTCEIVRFAPHLPWRDRNVRAELSEALKLPVRLEHDANSAAWGEYRYGAAKDVDNWVLFAVGTGIGATLMNGGEIYRGAFGTAPEFGHLCVVPDGRPCPCGKRGCLERYCSGTALVQTAHEMLDAQPHRPSVLRETEDFSGKAVMDAARAGDELALAVFEDFGTWLGKALSIVADVLDPGLIVIGGGVASACDLYMDRAKAALAESIVGAGHRPLPDARCASLGGDAGMIGVADLALRSVEPQAG
ncbi:ROK family protein [Corynebacterium gerontici]|uniref:Glucokinase n=1 Tax=Corynebacterium gerontici TaxID=2079234 RepID=A0A3G6J5R8_9CORY|nr:ROK family protein [Corynebacterium gerontici]AZA11790.1 Glucokinase [Corynebacterium gerontici]